jgi:hypothetical protein
MLEVLVGGGLALAIPFAGWMATTLVKILRQTSVIETVVNHLVGGQEDHEQRLRKLEE